MQQACKRAAREHRSAAKAQGCGERRCGNLFREDLGPWSVAECEVGRGAQTKEEPHESHRLATGGHRYKRVSEEEAKERRLRGDFNRNFHQAASECESLEGPSERVKVEKEAAKPTEPLAHRSQAKTPLRPCRRGERACSLVVPVNFKRGPANQESSLGKANEKRPCTERHISVSEGESHWA